MFDHQNAYKHITTTVMDSGLQISGVLEKCILNKRQELAYMTYNGGTQLSFKDCQLEGHSKEFHSEGYGCATGKGFFNLNQKTINFMYI